MWLATAHDPATEGAAEHGCASRGVRLGVDRRHRSRTDGGCVRGTFSMVDRRAFVPGLDQSNVSERPG